MTITATRPATDTATEVQDAAAIPAALQAYSITVTVNADSLDAANNLALDLACAITGTPNLAKARVSAPVAGR